ncbi:MAG: recombinase family protein, partial [Anaerolineae bacterium]|nr:recombinase family protein [Anaerolineae bacterium]
MSSRAQNEPDKISLPQQETDARALAEGNGWLIADILRVPGHSRRYIDFHRLASDAAKQGVDAFHRLQHHWEAQDFDVMIVRDGDRFARTQALHAYVVERTINIKARIYSLQDGWIDDTNYRMFIAMSGYKAAGDIDRLVKARDRAITARAQRGLPITSRIPMSHQVVRDQTTGKAICLQVNEDKRRLWTDLAELILEGVAWFSIEDELFNRYGHVRDNGERYYPGYL